MDAIKKVLETLWIGALLFVAGFMTWLMYANRPAGVQIAPLLFSAVSLLGVVVGSFWLATTLWRHGAREIKTLPFWIVLLMLGMSLVNWIGVPVLLARFGMGANMKLWHAIGMIIYLLECALGIVLTVQRK